MVTAAKKCNSSYLEAEAERWQVQSQLELQSKFKACLGDLVRPYLKRKSQKVLGDYNSVEECLSRLLKGLHSLSSVSHKQINE